MRFVHLEEDFEHAGGSSVTRLSSSSSSWRASAVPRPRGRGHRRRRGQHGHLPMAREQCRSAQGDRPRQRSPEPGALRPAGISPTVSATQTIMALIEHEVPEHDLIHLLELRKENLEIVEVQIDKSSPSAGKRVSEAGCRRLAADLRHARGPGGDPGFRHRAAGRRPGPTDPRAGQGRRAPPRSAKEVASYAELALAALFSSHSRSQPSPRSAQGA